MTRRPLTWAILSILAAVSALPAGADVLHRGNGDEPSTLDPQKTTLLVENVITGDLFMGLTTEDAAGRLIPGVAESWEISDDGLRHIYHLRDGLRWSDGSALTAEDFVFSFRRLVDVETAAGGASNLYLVENAEAIVSGSAAPETLGVHAESPRRLRIDLVRPAPLLPRILSYLYPVPAHVIALHGDAWQRAGNMVSNGAYRLVEWRPNEFVRVVRNEYFHEADSVSIDEVLFYPTENASTALNRFRIGDLDITFGVPSEQNEWVEENMPEALHITPVLGLVYAKINLRRPPFDDPDVRNALSMAVNRRAITDQLLRTGITPAFQLVPPGVTSYEPSPALFHDEDWAERASEARALMEAAGYTRENPLHLTFRYWSSGDTRKIAVALGAMWRQIGVEVTLHNAETRVHFADLDAGDFDIGLSGWTSLDDPAEFLDVVWSESVNNNGGYRNDEFDALFEAARSAADIMERAELLSRAEAIAMAEAAVIPIHFQVRRHLVASRVGGWIDGVPSNHRTRFLWIEPDQE